LDSNGNIYGTTIYGGQNGGGCIFQLAQPGIFTSLYSFQPDTGNLPFTGLTASGATMTYYGTTSAGGKFGHGTIFKMAVLPRSPNIQKGLGLKGGLNSF
jgi:uncharacterized repeat protein (TIGR03803 family)